LRRSLEIRFFDDADHLTRIGKAIVGGNSSPDLNRRNNIMDKTLEAMFAAVVSRNAEQQHQAELQKFALALRTLEILGLARSVSNEDGGRSWIATNELEWLASRDYIDF